mmetsp:Transcript_13021/g.44061  ORF Transcript_13021/g.44061 Transcript_13021/m.44061 type:complete len:379 (-) Transcript_13021:394-1530(-)
MRSTPSPPAPCPPLGPRRSAACSANSRRESRAGAEGSARGTTPARALASSCSLRRRFVSPTAWRMLPVTVSAYRTAVPLRCRDARPMVCTSAEYERRKPSLSASMMATSDTSGRFSPSRRRFTPTMQSAAPCLRPRTTSILSMGLRPEWRYAARTPCSLMYSERSSAKRFVRHVTRALSPRSAVARSSRSRSPTWDDDGRRCTMGSRMPVGRVTTSASQKASAAAPSACWDHSGTVGSSTRSTSSAPSRSGSWPPSPSTAAPEPCPARAPLAAPRPRRVPVLLPGLVRPMAESCIACSGPPSLHARSQCPGVADTMTHCPTRDQNSDPVRGRLSSADGRRKPCFTRFVLRVRSAACMAWTCDAVTWDSSTMSSQSWLK